MSMNSTLGDQKSKTGLPSTGNATSKLFDELVETSKNLPSSASELGSIQLSFHELIARTKNLREKTAKENEDKNYTKAHYLLAGSGISMEDFDGLYDTLNTDSTKSTPNHKSNSISDRRDEAFNSERTNGYQYQQFEGGKNILSSIESMLSNTAREFDSSINQVLSLDWNHRKDEVESNFKTIIKNSNNLKNSHFNTVSSDSAVSNTNSWSFDRNNVQNASSINKLDVNEDQYTRTKFEKYATVIYAFNNARKNKENFSLLDDYIYLLSSSKNENDLSMIKSYKILKSTPQNQTQIATDSKIYLENEFKAYLDNIPINSLYDEQFSTNLTLQSNINKVITFLNQKLKNGRDEWTINNLTVINNVPVWALTFFLLRAGLLSEAIEVMSKCKNNLKKIEQSFLAYFKAYASSKDGTLPKDFVTKLNSEYNQHIKNSLDGDPYRLAVYKIIGKCDLSRKSISSVLLTIEDWVWFHLMLITDSSSYESFTLQEFQNIALSFGPTKLGSNYLPVLLLSGLYVEAVQYLSTYDEISSVHLLIALIEKKAMNTMTGIDNINFAAILNSYIQSFKFSDPIIATEYLIVSSISQNPDHINFCKDALINLVLENKECALLLGKVNRNGIKLPGVLVDRIKLLNLPNPDVYVNEIITAAVTQADEEGRVFDSLLLYQLSEQYNVVIQLLNKLLGELLSEPELARPLILIEDNSETNPILLAENLINLYSQNTKIMDKINSNSFNNTKSLIEISKARSLYTKKNWSECLAILEALNMIPLQSELQAARGSQDLLSLDKDFVKIIPNLLLMTMTCTKRLYENISKPNQFATVYQNVDNLKKIARNCMIFAGTIQYKMPRDTYRALTLLDIDDM